MLISPTGLFCETNWNDSSIWLNLSVITSICPLAGGGIKE
jgi:hypothetical protein